MSLNLVQFPIANAFFLKFKTTILYFIIIFSCVSLTVIWFFKTLSQTQKSWVFTFILLPLFQFCCGMTWLKGLCLNIHSQHLSCQYSSGKTGNIYSLLLLRYFVYFITQYFQKYSLFLDCMLHKKHKSMCLGFPTTLQSCTLLTLGTIQKVRFYVHIC